MPATLTKFPASLAGPFDDIEITVPAVDWEVELVAVIGRRRTAPRGRRLSHVAGLAVGQDISDRKLQMAAGAQFSPREVTARLRPDWSVGRDRRRVLEPRRRRLGCSVDGEKLQEARTSDLVFSVPVSSPNCPPYCRCSPATSSSPAHPPGSGPPASRPASSSLASCWSRGWKAWGRSATAVSERTVRAVQAREPKAIRIARDVHLNVILLANRCLDQVEEICQAEGLTHSGDLLGTLQYMAPEQFTGSYDARGIRRAAQPSVRHDPAGRPTRARRARRTPPQPRRPARRPRSRHR